MRKVNKISFLGVIVSAIILAVIYFYPLSTFVTRSAFLFAIVLMLILLIFLAAYNKRVLYLAVGLVAVLIGSKLILQSSKPLSIVYADSLKKYSGTKYIWGGENSSGIDCSGLVRKSMVNALLIKSLADYDFSKMKLAVDIWWNDCTAKALQNGFRGYTLRVEGVLSVNDADSSLLREGDMAVSLDGLHIMAYTGNKEWVEADPMMLEVIQKKTPSENVWFKIPMEIIRWEILK